MEAESECVMQAPHLPPIWPGSVDRKDNVVRHKAIMMTPINSCRSCIVPGVPCSGFSVHAWSRQG